MQAFKDVHPHLIDEAELCAVMANFEARLASRSERAVADGKSMLALTFERAASPDEEKLRD
jgi:hypothetical protein